MSFALFRCCTMPDILRQYCSSSDAILDKLGIAVVDDVGFGCCGYPLRNFDGKAYLLAAARNLALAEKRSLDVMTVCNCCYGTLRHVAYVLQNDASARKEVNRILAKEGLCCTGGVKVKHLLQILHDEVGVENIRKKIRRTFKGLKIAVHYGCHILRPKEVVDFDNPFAPTKFDRLVEMTGARSIPWPDKLHCCGASVSGYNNDLSTNISTKKLVSAKLAGADLICVACPYCQIRFDAVRAVVHESSGAPPIPSILFTQLLGLCLDIAPNKLGLSENRTPEVRTDPDEWEPPWSFGCGKTSPEIPHSPEDPGL